jgi:hypothetical protein
MKKPIMCIAVCMLLAPGLAAAKEKTFSGEIMDSQCAKMGGARGDVQEGGHHRP